jgi:hypothetical protein
MSQPAGDRRPRSFGMSLLDPAAGARLEAQGLRVGAALARGSPAASKRRGFSAIDMWDRTGARRRE